MMQQWMMTMMKVCGSVRVGRVFSRECECCGALLCNFRGGERTVFCFLYKKTRKCVLQTLYTRTYTHYATHCCYYLFLFCCQYHSSLLFFFAKPRRLNYFAIVLSIFSLCVLCLFVCVITVEDERLVGCERGAERYMRLRWADVGFGCVVWWDKIPVRFIVFLVGTPAAGVNSGG